MAKQKEQTKEQIQTDFLKTNKELLYLLHYYAYSSNKTEAYTFANSNIVTNNIASAKSSASQYSNSVKVTQLEPAFFLKFEQAINKYYQAKGLTLIDSNELEQIQFKASKYKEDNTENEKEIDKEIIPTSFSENFTEFEELDLSNKDELLKELQRRYKLRTTDEKTRNEITKMIIDVQNMKKQEIQEDEDTIHYYVPLPLCDFCPHQKQIVNDNILKPYNE